MKDLRDLKDWTIHKVKPVSSRFSHQGAMGETVVSFPELEGHAAIRRLLERGAPTPECFPPRTRKKWKQA